MSEPAPARTQKAPTTRETPPDLRTQAHRQIMDYLRLAKDSDNPAIVEAAIQLAQERQRLDQKSDPKISPILAVFLATCVAIAAVCACWYALVYHPGRMGLELVIVVCPIAILVICMYALFSGHLSQENFMVVFQWVGDRLKELNPFCKGKDAVSLNASGDDELPPPGGAV